VGECRTVHLHDRHYETHEDSLQFPGVLSTQQAEMTPGRDGGHEGVDSSAEQVSRFRCQPRGVLGAACVTGKKADRSALAGDCGPGSLTAFGVAADKHDLRRTRPRELGGYGEPDAGGAATDNDPAPFDRMRARER
jgi:hypothetical protein